MNIRQNIIKSNIIKIGVLLFVMIIICSLYIDVFAFTNSEDYYLTFLKDGESFFYTSEKYCTRKNDKIYYYDVDELLEKIRLSKYKKFNASFGNESSPFSNSTGVVDEVFTGGVLNGLSIYDTNIYNTCINKKEINDNYFTITLDGEVYKFVIPAPYTYDFVDKGNIIKEELVTKYSIRTKAVRWDWDWIIFENTNRVHKKIVKAVKEGLLAVNVERGYNVGSVYSEEQKPLADVMREVGTSSSNSDGNSGSNTETNTSKPTGLFEFKANVSLKASVDYFYSPLFGKMEVTDSIPKTADEWCKDTYYNKIKIENGKVVISDDYRLFIQEGSALRVGLYEVDSNLTFTNGVQAFKKGTKIITTSAEPTKLVDYTMRIAVPNKFTSTGVNETYALANDGHGLSLIEGYRMSLYNDTIYTDSDTATDNRVKVCTNNDLDLERTHLVLYHQLVNGEKVGVVIVLKYSECVVDTTDGVVAADDITGLNKRLYFTGRNIVLNNNYSSYLKIDTENKDVMSYSTKLANFQGIKPRYFVFPVDGTSKADYITKQSNHDIIESGENFTFLITFVGEKPADTAGVEGSGTPYGFVIFRNNMYADDTELLNWLTTKEAKSLGYVKGDALRALIKGEFGSKDITFSEWLEMQRIQRELDYYKDTFLYRFINVLMIIIGSLLIILGMLFIVAYWFDIFNTFTELSILYIISGRNMYPIASDDMEKFVSREKSATKYVTFKGVMTVSIVCWFFGMIFLNGSTLMEWIIAIYTYIMKIIG